MPQLTWKNIGDLDFSDSNSLRVTGSEMVSNGAQTLTDLAKEIATKNAVLLKEERDLKFAKATQGMALAANENELRNAFQNAMDIEGIGAENVLGLTNAYKKNQELLLINNDRKLTNISQQQKVDYTTATNPNRIKADNTRFNSVIETTPTQNKADIAKNNIIINTANSTTKFKNASNFADTVSANRETLKDTNAIDIGLDATENSANKAKNLLTEKQLGIKNEITDKTKNSTIDTAIFKSEADKTSAKITNDYASDLQKSSNEMAISKNQSLKAKFDAYDKNYYGDKVKAEANRIADEKELRKLKQEAEKAKSAKAQAEYEAKQIEVLRKKAIASTLGEQIVQLSQQGKKGSIDIGKASVSLIEKLKSRGINPDLDELDQITKHMAIQSKALTLDSPLGKKPLDKFVKTDPTTLENYDKLNSSDIKVLSNAYNILARSNHVLTDSGLKYIPPNQQKAFITGLTKALTDSSFFSGDSEDAQNMYKNYIEKWFVETKGETKKKY